MGRHRIAPLLALALGASAVHAEPPQPMLDFGYASQGCSFLHSPVDFCDARHIRLIREALATRKPDFAQHYAVLSISEWPAYHQRSVVAVDLRNGAVHPLPIDAYSGPVGTRDSATSDGRLRYGLDSNRLCVDGAILAYRQLRDGTFCFTLQDGRFTGHRTPYMVSPQPR